MADKGISKLAGGGQDTAPFDFAAMLAVADALPVMIGFVDSQLRLAIRQQAVRRVARNAARGDHRPLCASIGGDAVREREPFTAGR